MTPKDILLVIGGAIILLSLTAVVTARIVSWRYHDDMFLLQETIDDLKRRYSITTELVSMMDSRIASCAIHLGRVTRAIQLLSAGEPVDLNALSTIEYEFGRQRAARMNQIREALNVVTTFTANISQEVAFNRALGEISRATAEMDRARRLDEAGALTENQQDPLASIDTPPEPTPEPLPWYDRLRNEEPNEPNR